MNEIKIFCLYLGEDFDDFYNACIKKFGEINLFKQGEYAICFKQLPQEWYDVLKDLINDDALIFKASEETLEDMLQRDVDTIPTLTL